MPVTISFTSGRRTMEGLVLAIGRFTMRVAVPGQSDALEFQYTDGCWTHSDGERLELDALFSNEVLGLPAFRPEAAMVSAAAN